MSMNRAAPSIATPLPGSLTDEAIAVRGALLERGLENTDDQHGLNRDQRYEVIRDAFGDIMNALGLDLRDDSLEETPHRIAKMYVDEVFSGLDYSQFPKITVIENKMNVEEMVCVEDIDLTSTCEHHFVTIDGSAKVAYIPNEKVIGLSKINRLVRFFAQRPQVQERLTQQILVAMQTLLGTENVAVTISAVHYCVKARGVKDGNSTRGRPHSGAYLKRTLHRAQNF